MATVTAGAAVGDPARFVDRSEAYGLLNWEGPTWRSGWVDIDLDGRAEPFFISNAAFIYLDQDAEGQTHLLEATVSSPYNFHFSASPEDQTPVVSGDFNRDGKIDLVTFAEGLRIFTITEAGVLEAQQVVAPRTPSTAHAVDAAAGDFNNDGWPDIVVGLGRFTQDHLYPLGPPDCIYMNRGGHFERVPLKPTSNAQTNGITVVDVDGDGRVDIIESFDFSQAAGLSRVLLNKTEPGASIPTFVVEENGYDYGSFGMGVAVADVNGDGELDIYNTSGGRDFLMLRQAAGGYIDATLELGIVHEFGTVGARVNWSPTFMDVNGDGLLDLFVRHGHITTTEFADFGLAGTAQMSLLYLRGADGSFQREPVPFDSDATYGGVDAVLGDLDGDGLPEMALGGLYMHELNPPILGRPEFWMNQFNPPEGSRHLVVRLQPTVSANPPTGAWVEGECDGVTTSIPFATGGKRGGLVPTEVHLSWASCTGTPNLRVRWPSGVTSKHAVTELGALTKVVEPSWFEIGESAEGQRQVVLHVVDADGKLPCFQATPGDDPVCCSAEASCIFEIPSGSESPGTVSLQGESAFALPPVGGFFSLVAEPSLPAPGGQLTIRASRAAAWTSPADFWLRVDGLKVPWTLEDWETGAFEATVSVASNATSVDVSLFLDTTVVREESMPVGVVVDPRIGDWSLWPYEDMAFPKKWRFAFAPANGVVNFDKSLLNVLRSDGSSVVPAYKNVGPFGRVIVEVPWDVLEDGDMLSITEAGKTHFAALPVYRTQYAGQHAAKAASIRGFNPKPILVENGDLTRLNFTVLDQAGHPLPPDPAIVSLEADGLYQVGDVTVPIPSRWEFAVKFRTTAGTGDASITFKNAVTGEPLAVWWIQKRKAIKVALDLEKSRLEQSYDSLPAGVGASAEVTVRTVNAYNELVGADADLTVVSDDEICTTQAMPNEFGTHTVTLETGYYGGEYTVQVFASDQLLGSVTLEVVGPQKPSAPQAAGYPDVVNSSEAMAELTPPPQAPEDSGCQSGTPRPWTTLLVLLVLLGFGERRRLSCLPLRLPKESSHR